MNDMSFPSGPSNENFSFRMMETCHKCGLTEDSEIVRKHWLRPYFVTIGHNSVMQSCLCPKCARFHLRFIFKNWRLGRITQWLAPRYSWCGKCKTTWQFVDGHTTNYSPNAGCFPLCEKCWHETDPRARLPYYRALWDEWQQWPDPDRISWEGLKEAVLTEK